MGKERPKFLPWGGNVNIRAKSNKLSGEKRGDQEKS